MPQEKDLVYMNQQEARLRYGSVMKHPLEFQIPPHALTTKPKPDLMSITIHPDKIAKSMSCEAFDERWMIYEMKFGGEKYSAVVIRRPGGKFYDVRIDVLSNRVRRVNNHRALVRPLARTLAQLVHGQVNLVREFAARDADKKIHKDQYGEVTILEPWQFVDTAGRIATSEYNLATKKPKVMDPAPVVTRNTGGKSRSRKAAQSLGR